MSLHFQATHDIIAQYWNMGPVFRRLGANIGVEVVGVNLRTELSSPLIAEVRKRWLEATVAVFRGQDLNARDLLRITGYFGKPLVYTRAENALPEHPEVLVNSNLKKDGRPMGSPASGRYWHSDGHYLLKPPAASFLYGVETPEEGGDTLFANCAAAYEALDEETRKRIDGRRVIISRVQSRPYNYPSKPPVTEQERAAWPDMPQPFVRTHPETGRRALYIGGNVPWRVEGMDEQESATLVTSLQQFSIRDEFVYRHRWRAGDLVIWDNRSAIHRATAYDEVNSRRLMLRTTIEGEQPFFTPQSTAMAQSAG